MCGGTNSTFLVDNVVFDSYTTVTCECAEQVLHETKKHTLSLRYCRARFALYALGKQ